MDLLRHLLVVIIVAGGGAGWIAALRRHARGQAVLARHPRRSAPWGLFDLALAASLLMTFQIANAAVLRHGCGLDLTKGREHLSSRELALATFSEPVASLAGIAAALAVVGWRTRAGCRDLGISVRHMGRDIALGLVAFAMLAPPVYAIQRLLVVWFPYRHPLVSLLEQHPGALVLAAVFVSAVVGAPIVEEFFYRVLWQGWLEDVGQRLDRVQRRVFGDPALPDAAPMAHRTPAEPDEAAATEPHSPAAEAAAIVASATLFAAMHVSQGPAPIPLFVLALGLGYVYARTGRILPCILVHMLLNGCSLATKLMELQGL